MKTFSFRALITLLGGFVVGMVVNTLVSSINMVLYPPPAGITLETPEKFGVFIATLPPLAFLIQLTAHAGGALVAGMMLGYFTRNKYWVLAVGAIFLVAGVMNLMSIPHPLWFSIVDALLYVPAAYAGGALFLKRKAV